MVAPPKPIRITLGDAVDRYLDAIQGRVTVGSTSARTLANYASDLAALVSIVGSDVIVDDVDGPTVDKAIMAFGREPDHRFKDPSTKDGGGRSPATQRRFRQSVSRFFAQAERNAWVQVSPMAWSTLEPTVRGGLRTARTSLSMEQATALLKYGPVAPERPGEVTRSHERNEERDRLILSLLVILGPRVSELVAANDEDFRTEDGQVVWRIVGKGGKVRHVPLSPWLVQRRDEYLLVRPEPSAGLPSAQQRDARRALVRTGRGMRMSPRDVQRLLERAYQRVLLAAPEDARLATPHALRHTAATLMLAAGWDVKVVSAMLGHASIATTGMYLDILPGELAEAVMRNPLAQPHAPESPTAVG